MLQRLATIEFPTPLPQAAVKIEEPPETPRQDARRAASHRPQMSRLERMASRERLFQRVKSPSKERLESGGGSRHRLCCQPTEPLFLPSVPAKLPPKTVLPPSPFGKLLRSAPTVPQAPLRPLRQWTPRGYPFPHRDVPAAEETWSSEEPGQVRLPVTSAEGGANDEKMGNFLAKFKSSTDVPELLAAPQKPSRTVASKGITAEVLATETPAEVIQEAKRRVSVEAAEHLRQQMRARIATQEAPPPAPVQPAKCGGDCGHDCKDCRRRTLRRGVSFTAAVAAGAAPEEGAEQSLVHSHHESTRKALLRRLTQGLEDAAAGLTASNSAGGGDAAGGEAQDASGVAGAVDGGSAPSAAHGTGDTCDAASAASAEGSEAVAQRSPRKDGKLQARLKSNLQERLRRLEKRHAQRKEQRKANREQDCRRQKFNALPKEEVDAIERVFSHVDIDGLGYIEQPEMMEGLKEMGLRGANTLEKREITQICTEAATEAGEERDGNSVDIVGFALIVVPRVRTRLAELRSNELLRQFYASDIRGTGKLEVYQCLEIARDLGIDQISFRKIAEEVHGNREGGYDFDMFQEMIVRAREHADRLVRERERRIKSATGISDEVFQEFRRDIVDLHALFQRYDTENNGTLGPEEMPLMLTEFGLMPKTPHERAEVEAVLRATDTDDDGVFTFEEFLHLTRQVRTLVQERKRASLLQFFERYDRDKSGSLSIEELSALLCDLGVVPRNRKEQEELAALIQLVDTDGSGFLDFEEFVVLNSRIDQRLKSMRYEEEIEFALSLGFTEAQLRDMRLVFVSLDVDGSNKLDAHEVRNGLQMMNKQVCNDAFDAAFKALDTDNSGELDFLEFLDFMRMMRDGEGIFCEDAHHLPSRVRLLDVRVLRRVVEYFGLSKTYVSALGTEELVELFCNLFEISQNDNLQEKLSITSVGELFEVAKKRGGQHF